MTEAELCWSKTIRWPLLRSRKTFLYVQRHEGSLEVKREGAPLYSKCGYTPTGLCSDIHPRKKILVHVGQGPSTGQVWEKKWDNWPNGNKDPEGLSHISDWSHLFTVLLFIRKDAHTLSEGAVLPSFNLQRANYFCVCSPIRCAIALIMNFVLGFTLFASLKYFYFQEPENHASSL